MITLKELREKAEKAQNKAPGPWEIEPKYDQIWSPKSKLFIGTEDKNCPATQFIVACDPLTITELLDRLEKACKALRKEAGEYDETLIYLLELAAELSAPLEEK